MEITEKKQINKEKQKELLVVTCKKLGLRGCTVEFVHSQTASMWIRSFFWLVLLSPCVRWKNLSWMTYKYPCNFLTSISFTLCYTWESGCHPFLLLPAISTLKSNHLHTGHYFTTDRDSLGILFFWEFSPIYLQTTLNVHNILPYVHVLWLNNVQELWKQKLTFPIRITCAPFLFLNSLMIILLLSLFSLAASRLSLW